MSFPERLRGMNVDITWKSGSDWHKFHIVDVDNEWPARFWFLLRGRNDTEKTATFDGGDFWIRLEEIELIKLED
jgi:hypothetical protein